MREEVEGRYKAILELQKTQIASLEADLARVQRQVEALKKDQKLYSSSDQPEEVHLSLQ